MNRQEARETLVYAIGEFVDNCIDAGDADKYWEAMTYYDSLPEVAPSNGDLISRADAIEAVRNSDVLLAYDRGWSCDVLAESVIEQTRDCLTHALKALPSAEGGDAETNPIPTGTGVMIQSPNGADLISRADAIEAVAKAKATDPFGRYDKQNIGIDWALDALESLPSASVEVGEWIPVSERLPDEGQSVYVTVLWEGYGDYITAYGMRTRYAWRLYSGVEGELFGGYTVIAWMPLPKPYERREP